VYHLERLPAYAPMLNPQEEVWNLLERVELKNLCCRDLSQVIDELPRTKERLLHLRSALLGTGLRLEGGEHSL